MKIFWLLQSVAFLILVIRGEKTAPRLDWKNLPCPEQCSCESSARKFEVNCHRPEFNYIFANVSQTSNSRDKFYLKIFCEEMFRPETLLKLNLRPEDVDIRLAKCDPSEIKYDEIEKATFLQAQKTQQLQLIETKVEKIDKEFFRNIREVKFLTLADSEFTKIEPDALSELNQLENVVFWNISIDVPESILAENKRLEVVTFLSQDDDRVIHLAKDQFKGPDNLKTVLIFGHFEFPDSIMEHSKSLQRFTLSRGNLTHLSPDLFKGQSKMLELGIIISNLKSLDEDAFADQTELRSLDLNGNKLQEIPQNIFRNLHKLSFLDLSKNELKSLPDRIFPNPSLLTVVELSNNFLEFPKNAANIFQHLNNLSKLQLNNNSLTEFSLDWSQNKPFLQFVGLRKNFLTTIDLQDLPLIKQSDRDQVVNLTAIGHYDSNVKDMLHYIWKPLKSFKKINFDAVKISELAGNTIVFDFYENQILNFTFDKNEMKRILQDEDYIEVHIKLDCDEKRCEEYLSIPIEVKHVIKVESC